MNPQKFYIDVIKAVGYGDYFRTYAVALAGVSPSQLSDSVRRPAAALQVRNFYIYQLLNHWRIVVGFRRRVND
jgi:hypothetical protein